MGAANLDTLRNAARRSVVAKDWPTVGRLATEIQFRFPRQPDGPYLAALFERATGRSESAYSNFERALSCDPSRYDIGIELAQYCLGLNRYDRARELLRRYVAMAKSSPFYLDMGAEVYFSMGMYEEAWPLYGAALRIQPNVTVVQMHRAACAVFLGKLDEARSIYRRIIEANPGHQRAHFELSKIDRATDDEHIKQMLEVADKNSSDPSRNIYLYYAIGKEYEDLEEWDRAFVNYRRAGDAVRRTSDYDVTEDVELIDAIIETCTEGWVRDGANDRASDATPVFIVGLPRTGTTLTDRIITSHSQVESAGETQLLQMVLRNGTRAGNHIGITVEQVKRAANQSPASIADGYMSAVAHRLSGCPYFTEKLPENLLYLGFIAKAWPKAGIVHLRRHPMDACFAMYKQSYFRFAYSLDDLANYYLAYDRLSRHWRQVLGQRIIEVSYEDLVSDLEGQMRRLLRLLGLRFEEACMNFETNRAPAATASAIQVREKIHGRSVGKWRKFEKDLAPLLGKLREGGVDV